MLESIAWNTFEITGSIEAYMFYRELEKSEFYNKRRHKVININFNRDGLVNES